MAKLTNEDWLADSALKLLAKKRWADLTLGDVAKAAKIPLAQLQSLEGGKPALIGLILKKLGAEAARRYRPEKGSGSSRDRIFDVAMAWFEANGARKAALRSLYEGLKFDPLTLIAMRAEFAGAASWLLTLAQADTGSLLSLRAIGVALIMARALPVWLDDDAEMTKTMAQLDSDLSRAENIANMPGADVKREA
jgi:AcrR family transcriptional regulator